jgi:uncharacterized membrane protein YhaH (DUF805 family)
MKWFKAALGKYATFAGRAQRAEYWYFMLFYVLIYLGLAVIDFLTGSFGTDAGIGLLTGIFSLGMILPSLAVGVRRLHDTSHSGWWLLIGLIPVVGGIILLIFFVQDSHAGTNYYGPNPKEAVLAS